MPIAYSYIRFSSPEQRKGDSLRRQMTLSEKYVAEHHLTLDTSFNLIDVSSAFHGHNVKPGAPLEVFMEAIKLGWVKPGSFLLVESLDRLSRARVSVALSQFTNIINAGINIVTLMDGEVYSQARVDENWTSLIMSISIMARAHDESATKSKRIAASWKNRRENARAGGLKLTKKCPRWLKLSDDRTEYVVIPEAVAVIERIFKMIIEGHGTHTIEYTFNREAVPTFGRKPLWNRNSVLKIINNRWVLGEYQPMLVQGGTRTPAGNPIPNYYPQIISESIYHAAHQVMEGKRQVAKGRKGKKIGNLLTGLCRCGYCGGPMVYIDKGQKSGAYLVCSHAKMGGTCNPTRWEYSDVELKLMLLTRELRVEEISSDPNKNVASRLAEVRGKIAELEKSRDNLITAIEQAPEVAALAKRLSVVDSALTEQLRSEEELSTLIDGSLCEEQRIADLGELRERLSSLEGPDLYNIRLRINSELKQFLSVVKFYSDGADPAYPPAEEEWYTDEVGKEHRYLVFMFKNGNLRLVN